MKSLDEFCPNIIKLNVSSNELGYLDGIPKDILELNASSNNLNGLTSFNDLKSLHKLDISNNNLERFHSLKNLKTLTHLNVNFNKIYNLTGLQFFPCLIKLELISNELFGEINLNGVELSNLEYLDFSSNSINSLIGLENLKNLRVLNLNNNELNELNCFKILKNLKKISLKSNKLKKIDLKPFPNLRYLKIDNNKNLNLIKGLKNLKHLEIISSKYIYSIPIIDSIYLNCIDVNKIYISKLSNFLSFDRIFMNLEKIELISIGLKNLPKNFNLIFPNLRELNLNFNLLKDIDELKNLKKLQRLYIVGNNIKKFSSTIIILKSLLNLKILDLRLNFLNKGFYPYVFNQYEGDLTNKGSTDGTILDVDAESGLIQLNTPEDIEDFSLHYKSKQTTHGLKEWEVRDLRHLEKLRAVYEHELNKGREGNCETTFYQKRLVYQALIVKSSKNLKILDSIYISRDIRESLKEVSYEILNS